MAKRKKASKVQKRAKLRSSAKRGKARKAAKAAKATKPTVAKAKPKPAPAKKAARKVKQPVAVAVETVAVEVIEQPAPGVITVTEVEETEVRKAS
jgi:methionyl-tRNA synthetase